ncbi:MAG: transglutaminase-like domain-containing protein [Lachnospiraceae bacterium]|nr:transglutaminase-like domain-containing protein [Lachnospiraceae bacterium]
MNISTIRKKSVLLLFLCGLLLLTACGQQDGGKNGKKSMIIPAADGKKTLQTDNLTVDISHLDLGYFMVKYTGSASKLYVQLVGPDQEEYKYFLEPSQEYETLPLTAGSGEYYLCAYENIGGEQYSPILSQLLQAELANEFGPFLCSNQYVKFTQDSEAVSLAAELTADITDNLEKVRQIYRWVVRNIDYDYDKAMNVSTGYLPDVDRTLKSKQGICFDYAALMAAMLRSLGIPAKLNIGYLTGDIYHAWISVYLDETGWVENLVQFNGADWEMMDPTVASSAGNQEAKNMASDDANYIVRYVR